MEIDNTIFEHIFYVATFLEFLGDNGIFDNTFDNSFA